jgi:hypothetical protein
MQRVGIGVTLLAKKSKVRTTAKKSKVRTTGQVDEQGGRLLSGNKRE